MNTFPVSQSKVECAQIEQEELKEVILPSPQIHYFRGKTKASSI